MALVLFLVLLASRRSAFGARKSLILATFLGALGSILNLIAPIPIFLDYYILIGFFTSWLALFVMRGWWSVVVVIPAAITTIHLFGQPVSAILYVLEAFVVTWIYRTKMVDDAVERGRLVFLVILYAFFIHGPLYFIGQYYILGVPFDFSKLVAYKAILNSNICVLLAYLVYVIAKLFTDGRSRYKPNSISVGGLVFLSSYGVTTIVVLIMTITFFNYFKSGLVQHYYDGMKIQASSVFSQFIDAQEISNPEASILQIRQIDSTVAPGIEYQVDLEDQDSYTSDQSLFDLLDSSYIVSSDLGAHLDDYSNLNLMVPSSSAKGILNEMAESIYVFTAKYDGSLGSSGELKLVQDAKFAIFDDVNKHAAHLFNFLALSLPIAAAYSFWLSSRAESEINTLFSASLASSSDVDGDLSDANISDSPNESVLRYSPIREISRGVDVINRNFDEIRESRDSIRTLNAIAQKQLTNAGTIQQSFLVKNPPNLSSVDINLFMQPAYNAGGDWYDAFARGDKLFLVIADVCDKGVPAALFMSVFRSLIRYDAVSRPRWDLSDEAVAEQMVDVITHVNDYMSLNHGDDVYFATVLFVVLDQKTGCMTYISAGHESPLIFLPSGECIQLETTGKAVGIFKDSQYVAKSLLLPKGSTFVGFTDGVIDARNELDESFTTKRLITLCEHLLANSPVMSNRQLMDSIKAELMSHIGKASQFDDITLATLMYH